MAGDRGERPSVLPSTTARWTPRRAGGLKTPRAAGGASGVALAIERSLASWPGLERGRCAGARAARLEDPCDADEAAREELLQFTRSACPAHDSVSNPVAIDSSVERVGRPAALTHERP
jgi:hypothetical protein